MQLRDTLSRQLPQWETKALHLGNGVNCMLQGYLAKVQGIYTPIPMLLRVTLEGQQWPGVSGLWYEPRKCVPAAWC